VSRTGVSETRDPRRLDLDGQSPPRVHVVRRRGRQSGRKLTVSSRAARLGPHWSCQYVVIGQEKHRNSTGQNAAYCMTACSTCHTRDTSDGCSIGLQPGRDPARRHASATLHPGRPICLLADFQAIGTGLGMTCQNSSRLALRLNLVSREHIRRFISGKLPIWHLPT
jgi:hypothetical protein